MFVYISAVEEAGFSTLNEGDKVSYEEVPNKGKDLSGQPSGRLIRLPAG